MARGKWLAASVVVLARCDDCEIEVFSSVFTDGTTNFCPWCGEKLNLTGDKFKLLPEGDYERIYNTGYVRQLRDKAAERSRQPLHHGQE